MHKFDHMITTARQAANFKQPVLAGNSVAAHALRQMVSLAAQSVTPAQIEGMQGPGVREIAVAIHSQCDMADEPFVDVDCHMIRNDHFAIRWHGTLFLGDAGELSAAAQRVLLDWMESDDGQHVRVVSTASKKPVLPELQSQLATLVIPYPPLAERRDDIPVILQRLWAAGDYPLPPMFDRSAWSAVLGHNWAGNFDELTSFSARAARMYGGREIGSDHVRKLLGHKVAAKLDLARFDLKEHLAQEEKLYLVEALLRSNGVVAAAAGLAGVNRTTFLAKMRKYGLAPI
ncbi:MAG: hypothetical protein RL481_722 [Pseudomonadota bacterium]